MFITVSSVKGGVGKSTVAILLANNLAARGKKVLVIDTDLNNTATVYYTMGIGSINEICERKNVSFAFIQGKLDDNIIKTRKENIWIVPSSLRILDQRSMESIGIRDTLRSIKGFDEVIIDTSPTYDNIVAGTLLAADLILNPVVFTEYNFNTSAFLYGRMKMVMPEQIRKLFFLFCQWSDSSAKNPRSLQNQVLSLYARNFSNIIGATLPKTNYVDRYTNTDDKVSIHSGITGSKKLALDVNNLVNVIYNENSIVEVF